MPRPRGDILAELFACGVGILKGAHVHLRVTGSEEVWNQTGWFQIQVLSTM